jgi:hypothetical protein
MPRRLWLNRMVCSRPSSWLNAFVLTLAAPMNHIWLLSKRSRDYALATQKSLSIEICHSTCNLVRAYYPE